MIIYHVVDKMVAVMGPMPIGNLARIMILVAAMYCSGKILKVFSLLPQGNTFTGRMQ